MTADQRLLFSEKSSSTPFPTDGSVLGGAPFNVARTLRALRTRPTAHQRSRARYRRPRRPHPNDRLGLDIAGLQTHPERPTGHVQITIQDSEPDYDIATSSAWDDIRKPAPHVASSARLLYHGSLALRTPSNEATLQTLHTQHQAPRFYDLNLRFPHHPNNLVQQWLPGTDWLKLNIHELSALLDHPIPTLKQAEPLLEELADRYDVATIILTAGTQGALMRNYGTATIRPAPAPPKPIIDTVGAGDAFTARIIHGLLRKEPAQPMLEAAANLASRICTIQGATTNAPAFYR